MVKQLGWNGSSRSLTITKDMLSHLGIDTSSEVDVRYIYNDELNEPNAIIIRKAVKAASN